MILMRVDLPAPLSPRRPTTSPEPSRKSTSWRTWTPPKDFATPRSSRRSGAGEEGWRALSRPPATWSIIGRGGRTPLPDLLRHERGDGIDVGLVDEPAARVDEQAAEAVLLGHAELLDGLEALEGLLLGDDQGDVAVLDALDRRGRGGEAAP